jgi:hypothetical protein
MSKRGADMNESVFKFGQVVELRDDIESRALSGYGRRVAACSEISRLRYLQRLLDNFYPGLSWRSSGWPTQSAKSNQKVMMRILSLSQSVRSTTSHFHSTLRI